MSKHIAILTATSAIALAAFPAQAQQRPLDDRYADIEDAVEVARTVRGGLNEAPRVGADYANVDTAYAGDAAQNVVQDYVYDEVVQDIPAYAHGDYGNVEYDRAPMRRGEYGHGEYGHAERYSHHTSYEDAPAYAYSAEQREEWLAQCRALRARYDEVGYYEDDDDGDGGLLGGLLGAIAGGVVGNRVADGERLVGTLIGAGLGGLAGAVIGSALDGGDDDDDDYYGDGYGFDYCEAYLLNYERGYGVPSQVTYAPVTMVPVAQQTMTHRQHRPHRRVVTRVVEQEVVREHAPARRVVRRAAPAPRRQHGKVQPLR